MNYSYLLDLAVRQWTKWSVGLNVRSLFIYSVDEQLESYLFSLLIANLAKVLSTETVSQIVSQEQDVYLVSSIVRHEKMQHVS